MEFDVRIASTVSQALSILAEAEPDAESDIAVIAGGTDMMIQLARGQVTASTLLHIEALSAELGQIEPVDGAYRIGALVSHRMIVEDQRISSRYPSLAESAAQVGGWQTQAAGTLAGNICNASPAADAIAPLLVHDAQVVLQSKARGERIVELGAYLLGRRKTVRAADELVTHIVLPEAPENSSCAYRKIGRRSAMEVAIAGLAVRLVLTDDQMSIADARLATCAVGPVPARCVEAEKLLNGQYLDSLDLERAKSLLRSSISPIDDARSTASYRREVIPRVLGSLISRCAGQAARL